MADDNEKPDYKIGYGKPPVHSQFTRGQSGNPAGRPPGSRNTKKTLIDVGNEEVQIKEGDEWITVTKQEALFKSLYASAIKGNTWAARVIMENLAKYSGLFDR